MTSNSSAEDSVTELEPGFLPNFCSARVVILVIIMAELLACILTMASSVSMQVFWLKLALLSLFIQWIALGNIVFLCFSRRWLHSLTPLTAAGGSYGLSLIVTLAVSIATLNLTPQESLGYLMKGYSGNEFVLRNMVISAIVSAVALHYFYMQHQWMSNIQTEAHARIQALQARIRPHFLFNSMNTIASLTRTDPALAEKAVEDLADLFRASLGHEQQVALSEELQFTRRYINIEQLRLGDRLKIKWYIDKAIPSNAKVPALLLQPLVENSIYHGIETQTAPGTVTISIKKTSGGMHFSISNPIAQLLSSYRRSGNQMAQDNIRQRLKLAYGDSAKMIINKTNTDYTVSFTVPIREKP